MKKFTHFLLAPIAMLLLLQLDTSAQVVFTNSTPGTYTFTVPTTTLYNVECWGGGGRGGPRSNDNGGAGGGGGGAYSKSTLLLTPGTYNIKVGAGGAGVGGADGDSSYLRNGALLVLAMGGNGVNPNSATGVAGGSSALGIGTTKYSGGAGANGALTGTFFGGGGGSSAGTGVNGNNALLAVGGIAPVGGAKGGNGKTGADGPGLPADNPGGGGGGARKTSSGGGPQGGGAGGAGMVIITLACVPPTISVPASNLTVECDGAGNAADLTTWVAAHGNAVAIDGCGALTWTNTSTTLTDDCGATGSVTVTFTVSDENGNTATTSATFTIEDTTPPDAVCQDITLEFDAYGNVSTTAEDVDNGSSDICGGVTLSLSQTDFDCSNLGGNTVTLTVTDDCDNSSTCTATVTVIVPLAWRCHDDTKVIFCHIPPNYPAQNIQEVCVGMDIETICDHLGHGDHFGGCDGTEEGFKQAVTDTDYADNNVPSENISKDQLHVTQHVNGKNNDLYVQPNPFTTQAAIHFNMIKKDNVVLKVFNSMGEIESVLYTGTLDAGQHTFSFDGTGKSEGLYYINLAIGSKLETMRILLAR